MKFYTCTAVMMIVILFLLGISIAIAAPSNIKVNNIKISDNTYYSYLINGTDVTLKKIHTGQAHHYQIKFHHFNPDIMAFGANKQTQHTSHFTNIVDYIKNWQPGGGYAETKPSIGFVGTSLEEGIKGKIKQKALEQIFIINKIIYNPKTKEVIFDVSTEGKINKRLQTKDVWHFESGVIVTDKCYRCQN